MERGERVDKEREVEGVTDLIGGRERERGRKAVR